VRLWTAVFGVQMPARLIALAVERENPLPLLWMPLQQLVHRQLVCAVSIESMGPAPAAVAAALAEAHAGRRLRVTRARGPRTDGSAAMRRRRPGGWGLVALGRGDRAERLPGRRCGGTAADHRGAGRRAVRATST
jgi:hypothetical protein